MGEIESVLQLFWLGGIKPTSWVLRNLIDTKENIPVLQPPPPPPGKFTPRKYHNE